MINIYILVIICCFFINLNALLHQRFQIVRDIKFECYMLISEITKLSERIGTDIFPLATLPNNSIGPTPPNSDSFP